MHRFCVECVLDIKFVIIAVNFDNVGSALSFSALNIEIMISW